MRTTTTIKLSDDLELEIEGYYTPEEPMVWNLPNGDPGYPGSASELDIQNVKIVKGDLMELISIFDSHQYSQVKKVKDNPNKYIITEEIWEYLKKLAIKQIEENE